MRTSAKWTPILVFALIASSAAQDAGSKPTPPPVPPPLHLAIASLTPEARIAIGGERQIAAAGDGLWVSSRTAGTLTRIDPKTNAAATPLAVGEEPCYTVLSAFGSLWTPLCGVPGIVRVDSAFAAEAAKTDKPAVPPGADKPAPPRPATVIFLTIQSGGPIVSGIASIWMITNPAGTLSRIDPDANAVVAEITVPAGASAVAFGDDAVWVTSTTKDTVTRVNGHTNVVTEHVKVGRGPAAVAFGVGAVWVHNSGDGTVSRVDPKTNKVTSTIKTGVMARGAVAVGEGSVWLSAPGWPLTRIDPTTNVMVQQFTGPGGGAIAIGHKSIWIAATPGEIWRVDPKRVEATRK